jgi:F plasmid transfer operon protein TraF
MPIPLKPNPTEVSGSRSHWSPAVIVGTFRRRHAAQANSTKHVRPPCVRSDNSVMPIRPVACTALAAALVMVCSAPARAQLYESVGTRAQGMGGAFVAVADDATASWWNPAGLATGAYFNVVVERGRTTEPADPTSDVNAEAAAFRSGVTGFSVAFPALGLSYYTLRVSEIGPSVSASMNSSGEQGESARDARSLSYRQFGVTVGQSLNNHFVVGSTVKLVRVGAASATVEPGRDALDAADDLGVPVRTSPGLDLGAMATFRRVRVGMSIRNVKEIEVGTEADPIKLKRQARAGLALFAGTHSFIDGITAALDVDLTRTETRFGQVRHVATGAEAWLFGKHLGVRGGFAANTSGERRPTTSVGVSVAPWSGFFVEAASTKGRDESLSGWITSLRLTF